MALTDYQAETVKTQVPFLQRVALNLGVTLQNIESEATSTALHAQRVRLASQIVQQGLTETSQIVQDFADHIVDQLPLASTSLVTANGIANGDVDTTDSALQTIISSIYNAFISS